MKRTNHPQRKTWFFPLLWKFSSAKRKECELWVRAVRGERAIDHQVKIYKSDFPAASHKLSQQKAIWEKNTLCYNLHSFIWESCFRDKRILIKSVNCSWVSQARKGYLWFPVQQTWAKLFPRWTTMIIPKPKHWQFVIQLDTFTDRKLCHVEKIWLWANFRCAQMLDVENLFMQFMLLVTIFFSLSTYGGKQSPKFCLWEKLQISMTIINIFHIWPDIWEVLFGVNWSSLHFISPAKLLVWDVREKIEKIVGKEVSNWHFFGQHNFLQMSLKLKICSLLAF